MKKSNKDKKSIFRSISLKFITMALSLGVAILLIFVLTTKDSSSKSTLDPDFVNLNNYYNGRQAHIKNPNTTSSTDYISMTNAASANSNNGKTITISDYNELYLFSSKCNSNTAFLGYNYVLNANIDYKKSGNAFIPVGWKGTAFTGKFDGQGYEINDLYMTLTSTSGYSTMKYFSMFSIVGSDGIVTNLGLNNPDISTTVANDVFAGEGGVSYLVGENNGTVSNSFIVDERSADESKGGIAAGGGCRIADLCVVNNSSLTNNYVVTGIVVNKQTTDFIEFTEIALKNTGTLTNNFYYNASIQSYDNGTVVYKDKYNLDTKTGQNIGTYCSSVKDLITKVKTADSTWYTADSYPLVKDKVGIDYAIRRGVSISGYEITINNEKDFAYMYELFNTDDYMASDKMSYKITSDLDLSILPVSTYSYDRGIGATIYGASIQGNPTLVTNNKSEYPTIYNADVMNSARVVKNAGVDCYGLFNFVTGTIENLNIVPLAMDLNDVNTTSTSNIKGIGAVSGYVEGGQINNVNVYATISNSTNKNIGEYCLGGVTGVLGGNGKITNTTSAGSITLNSTTNTISGTSSYFNGIAIGGIVGYVESSLGTLYTCLNAMNITSYLGTNTDYAIGGVIGAGYTTNSLDSNNNEIMTSQLENLGTITVGNSTYHTYNTLYVSGIIGRHLGVTNEVGLFTNSGTISVYAAEKETYVSGVENADILSSATSTGRQASQFKNTAGNTLFYASSLSNGGNVTVTGDNTYLQYTDVLNIKASNGIVSTVSNLFNLSYYAKYDETITYQSEPFRTNYKLADQTIAMNTINTFAPVLNVVGGSATNTTTANRLYNLRNINYTISSSATKNFTYAGVALGQYINYEDCRNEGNLTFTLNQAITGNLTVSGLFNEVSSGAKASDLYNAGNITINYTATFTGNINASGICNSNQNGFTDSEIALYNPSNVNYDKSQIGSINNIINSGDILVTNPNYSSIQFTGKYDILSANGTVTTERHYYASSAPSATLVGNIYAAGVTNYNYSVITNAFNLANVTTANYIKNNGKRQEVNSSGLVSYNLGKYAIIENSANDGDIKAINLSFYMVFNNGQSNVNDTTAQYAFVNAAGIVNRNDANLDGSTYSNAGTNSKQIIAFTINYGSIYSYNYARNSLSSDSASFRTISAGILGQGLLNVINVLNYGNIYGSEVSGGIIGVMFFNSFNTEVNQNNTVNLANTINYGNVKLIDKGQLAFRSNTYYPQTYTTFLALNNDSTYYVDMDVYSKDYYNGSIFGIINFSGNSNAKYVIIRYLISFNEDVSIVSAEAQTPSVSLDLTTFYSAYLDTSTGYDVIDTYMGQNVVYAPLSTGSVNIDNTTYYGVFNTNFSFQQAIKGNADYLDTDKFVTDIFITDYFDFIGATYVNDILLDKIGWGAIAYNAAADSFATDLEGVALFIDYIKGLQPNTQYSNLITAALNTDTWLSKCNNETLLAIVNGLINNEDSASLLAMIRYLFSTSATSYSLINTSTRVQVLEAILNSDLSLSYNELLDELITYNNNYSSILANAVLDSSDEAGEYLHSYISSLTNSQVEEILSTYCTYLKDASTNAYFTYSNSEQVRYDILTAMFENITDDSFFQRIAELINVKTTVESYSLGETLAMYEGYDALSDEAKLALYKRIMISNTSSSNPNRIYTYLSNAKIASEIEFYSLMLENGYSKTSLDNISNDVSATAAQTATSTIDERIKLWNQIKDTDVFKQYLSSSVGDGLVAKATEFRNTYQTTTVPYDSVNDSIAGDMSYAYTFDITPATYFLGPYTDKYKTQFYYEQYTGTASPTNGDPNSTARSIMDVTTLEEAKYLYENGYTKAYQLFYYEYSDSSSNNQLCAVQRSNDYTSYYGTYGNDWVYAFTWYKTSKTTDFTGGFIRGTYTDTRVNGQVVDSSWEDTPIYITVDGEQIDVNGGGISKFTSDTNGTTQEAGWHDNLNKTGKWTITDANNKQYTQTGTVRDWADFIIAHEVRHYISYPTEKLHSTLCTGVGKFRSGNRWFTFHSGNPVYTSQYIDYSVDDLLKLDGYLTSYSDGTTVSEDERSIINSLFNEHFVTDGNFDYVIAAALLERNAYVDTDVYYPVTNLTLNQNFTLYYTVSAATTYNSNTKYYVLSNGNYVLADQSQVNSTNYSNYYVLTRAKNYSSGTTYYYKKEIDSINMDYLDNFFIKNIYTSNTINDTKPFNYLYYNYSSTTVRSYLTGNSSSDFKDKFLAYCAANQSAYANLLLKLIEINNLGGSTLSFPLSIGNSSSDNITIENIASYDTLRVVNSTQEFNGDTYDYGYTFKSIEINGLSTYTKLILYIYSPSSVNLTYSIDNGANQTYNVNGNTFMEVELNGNSSVKITVPNAYVGDVVLYYASGVYEYYPPEYERSITYYTLNEPNDANKSNIPGYYIYQLPTENEIENKIISDLNTNNINPTSVYYDVSISVTAYRFNTDRGNNRYVRIVLDDDGSTNTQTDVTTLGTSNDQFTYNWQTYTKDNIGLEHLGKYVGLMISTKKASGYTYENLKTSAGYYRYQLKQIYVEVTYWYTLEDYLYSETALLNEDMITNSALDKSTTSNEELLSGILYASTNYSNKYNTLLDDATHNLLPIDYSESAYLNKLVSDTYYINGGNTYSHTTGSYDSNKKYYTYSNNEYSLALINSSTYYNTVESGKYYVSYKLADVPYDSSGTYYTKNGNVYTKLNSLSEQDFYNSVNITNNTYYVITDNTDPDNPVYGLAGNTYDSSATYYTRSGDGTNENPYVYTQTNVTIAQFYAGGTSNTYYVNGGTNYQLATRAFDNNLTYYTYDNGTYTAASINETQYYNSTTSNTYYSNFVIAGGIYNTTANTYFTRSGSGTSNDPYVYTLASPSSSQYYSTCTSTYYYVKNGDNYTLATGDYNSSTTYYHLEDSNYVSYGNASKNIKDILGLSPVHTSENPEYCVPDLIKKLITSSNEAFLSFVNEAIVGSENEYSDLKVILTTLLNDVGYIILNDAIKTRNTSLATINRELIAAAYLTSNYRYILNNSTSVYDSFLRTYIDNTMVSTQHYILSDGTYNFSYFEAFCHTIGYNLSTAGYGIYALASNQGKLNGLFIPDNLDITTKDPYYATETVESSDILVLQSSTSSEWRGGNTVAQNDTSSINYAFFKDMKQIEQSISTTVFELDINYQNDTYYGDIDLDKKTVTYYVPSIVKGAYTITNIKLAYGATSNLGTTISVTSTSDNVIQDSFIVTAQNTAVEATYTVIFKTIDVEFTLKYKNNSNTYTMTADASDTTVELKVTSNENKKLPEGLNLEHYISFVGIKNTYDMSSQYLTISALSTDHRVDSNGNAIITIVVSNKLPADTYEITLSFAGHSSNVDFNKSASSACVIESMTFDGNPVSISATMNSTVQFGRAYNYSELTDYTSDDFYLYNFKYSNNATVDITATKSVDGDGLMTYDVMFVITAENGNDSNTYHHLVKEKQFFNENSTYASIYATGETVGIASGTVEEEDRHKYLSDGTLTYNLDNDTYVPSTDIPDPQTGTWSLNDNMKAEISFNRGIQPQYRIKYNLSNFYTLGVSVQMGPTSATLANGAAVNPTYAGLTVTVTNNNDTGTYVFVYTYTNTGTWVVDDDEVTYTRYYEFPELVIKKLASTDALLHQLTFLEEYVALGNTATVILPDNVLVPDKSDVGEGSIGYNSDDALYEDEFNSTTRSIRVASDEIIYNNNSDAKNISDYYAIGTVSDADLSYYCPTFSINKYAQMYQYTTYLKLTEYGTSQTKKDETVLTDHDNMFLYVPYEKDNKSYVFLVELDSDGYWTNVYTTDFNGKNGNTSGIKIGTYTAGSVNAKNAKDEGNIAGYTVADYAGQATDNQSLFMDYIGTPHQGHFWYVSYVIFSEDKLTGGDDAGNVRYYHISIIDATNNIQFNVTVYADNDLDLTDIYLTISENIYKEGTTTATFVNSRQISAYAVDTEEVYSGSRTDIAGYKIYELKFSLQTLPKGYFYFYIDLPDGFVAITHTDMANQLGSSTDKVGALVETGAFLPYTSIITQKIALEFIVNKGEGEQAGAWAVNTTDISSKDATYSGLIPA